MVYNKESGYGRTTADAFPAVSPNGRQFIVGAATLDNVQIAQQIFKADPYGILRFYSTVPSAVAATYQAVQLSVTVSTTADTFTTSAPHSLNNGDKVYVGGTSAPTGTTAGVVYYVVGVTATAPTVFQVSATRGGSAIDLSSTGTAVVVFPLQSSGDTIFVLPSHNENVSSATALNFNVAGLTIIGIGNDETRPTLYLDTATTTTITFSAPAVTLQNFIIDATGFDNITSAVTVTASDVKLVNNKFNLANATNQAAIAITTTAQANRLKLYNNYFFGTTDAGTTNVIQLIGGNDIEIVGNRFIGAYTTSLGAINNITTACLRLWIQSNFIFNQTASSTKAIVLLSSSTGMISQNYMQILSGTAPITGAAMSWVGNNYYAATIATAGTLI